VSPLTSVLTRRLRMERRTSVTSFCGTVSARAGLADTESGCWAREGRGATSSAAKPSVRTYRDLITDKRSWNSPGARYAGTASPATELSPACARVGIGRDHGRIPSHHRLGTQRCGVH